MAIVQNFESSQTIGSPETINLEDTSTGSDAAISVRWVYLVDAQGEYVVPTGTSTDYVVWPYADDTTEIECLTSDAALWVTVKWLNSGNTVLYSKTILCAFTLFSETFYYSLTQAQATQSVPPNIVQDTGYYTNKMILRTLIDSGNNAVTYGQDITTAQNMYDGANYMVDNESEFF